MELQGIRRRMRRIPGFLIYDYPALPELTQWRFSRAVIQGNEPLAIHLLSLGADPNKDPRFWFTPVEAAILGDHRNLLEALIKKGADLEQRTAEGKTPVELAKSLHKRWAILLLAQPREGVE
jgi:hypothetical protein